MQLSALKPSISASGVNRKIVEVAALLPPCTNTEPSDNSIIMKIKVSRNAPDESVATLDGTPGIAKNQVQTETLVKDGQTLVLGGIYVVDRSETGTAVPFLNRLPFLGALFRSNEVRDERKELLVFVSPRVVEAQVAPAS